MLAIETRYFGPSNYRGSRIKARVMESAPTRQITLSWDDALGCEENHKAAARALIAKLGWDSDNGYGEWRLSCTVRAKCITRNSLPVAKLEDKDNG